MKAPHQPTILNPFGTKAFPYVGLGIDPNTAKPKKYFCKA
jgi:hypothetical protein